MATKKTTPASGAPRRKTAAKATATKGETPKSEPVVLDPPAKATAKPAAKPEVIEAKAVEVTPAEKTGPVDSPKPVDKPAPEKPAEKPSDTPAATAPQPKPEPAKPNVQAPKPQAPKSGGGFGRFAALFAGGAVAAALGYFAGMNATPQVAVPVDNSAEITRVQSELTGKIEQLQAKLDAMPTEAPAQDLSGFGAEIQSLKDASTAATEGLSERLAAAESRLKEMSAELDAARVQMTENLGSAGAQLGTAATDLAQKYDAEIEALKSQIKAQIDANSEMAKTLEAVSDKATEQLSEARSKIAELSSSAVETVRNADLTVAVTRLQAAIDTGKSYAAVLAEVANDAAVAIPDALAKSAEQGVAPLLKLQQDFPEAARNGLKASIKATAGEGFADKLAAFVKAQVGARSLEEKPGNDPDAILSRAQGALNRGQLQDAVDLVRQLPADGMAAMSDWILQAQNRLDAYQALKTFAQSLQPKN